MTEPSAAGPALPLVGHISKRGLWIAGAGAVGLLALLWWRKRNAAPAVAAVAADSAGADASVDPNLDPFATDPNTDPYGAGGGGALDASGQLLAPAQGAPIDNQQWTAQVMATLAGVVDPAALSAALGRYLTGTAVDAADESLIDQAIAAAGYPPVAGATGYPPGLLAQPATGQTAPGGGVTAPPSNPRPAKPNAPTVTGITATTVSLSTTAVPGATLYEWSINGANHTHTTSPTVTITGLVTKTTYQFSVEAQTATAYGDDSDRTTATTK
jgi:hypothetical protein